MKCGLVSARCHGCGGGGLNRLLRRPATRTETTQRRQDARVANSCKLIAVNHSGVLASLRLLGSWFLTVRSLPFSAHRTASWLLPEVPLRDPVAEHTHGHTPRFKKLKQRPCRDEIGSSRDVRVYEGVVCHLQHWA